MTVTPERCVTCADEAVTARVVAVEGAEAVVVAEGVRGAAEERVALDLVDGVRPGELLLCHAGIALSRVAP